MTGAGKAGTLFIGVMELCDSISSITWWYCLFATTIRNPLVSSADVFDNVSGMRLRLAALGFAVLVIVGGIYGVDNPAVVLWFQQNINRNWLVGTVIAVVVGCAMAQELYETRKSRRVETQTATEKRTRSHWWISGLYLALFVSGFYFLHLSKNSVTIRMTIGVMAVLLLLRIIRYYASYSKFGLAFEITFLVVLLWGVFSGYAFSLHAHHSYMGLILLFVVCFPRFRYVY